MTAESVEGIMLEASSGDMAFTNSDGNFSIHYQQNDTVSFFIAGKLTNKLSADSLGKIQNLIISLQSIRNKPMRTGKITYYNQNLDTTTFNNVTVTAKNYHADSLARRNEYKEAFNYTKPKLKFGEDWGPTYINVGKLAETLNKKKKKRHTMLKNNLLREEKEDYVDNRCNRSFVQKYLGQNITDEKLQDFMRKHRPKYEDIVGMSDLELIDYIRLNYKQYQENSE